MHKTIPIARLRVGMYVERVGGRWLDHPFWRRSFAVETPDQVRDMMASGVPEVVIDTKRGLDVEPDPAPPPDLAPEADEPETASLAAPSVQSVKVSFEDEYARARQLHGKAKVAVTKMFTEARMGRAIEISGVEPLVAEIQGSLERNADALLSVIRLKTADDYTYMHSVAVCGLMIGLGRRLGLGGEELRQVGLGGLLHDVGKIALPLEVLNKPGKLTGAEYAIMKTHPERGWNMLRQSDAIGDSQLDVCLHHHERTDGKGYPQGLSGDSLSLHARMAAVCDVYDAITSDRPYKSGWAPAESIKRMAKWCDGQFDETIFKAFVSTLGIYPAGSVVRLESGRLAAVTGQSEAGLLLPVVTVFFSLKSSEPIPLETVALARSQDRIAGIEDAEPWQAQLQRIFPP